MEKDTLSRTPVGFIIIGVLFLLVGTLITAGLVFASLSEPFLGTVVLVTLWGLVVGVSFFGFSRLPFWATVLVIFGIILDIGLIVLVVPERLASVLLGLLLSIPYVSAGIGLLRFRHWARILMIFANLMAILSMVSFILLSFWGAANLESLQEAVERRGAIITAGIFLVINALSLLYLIKLRNEQTFK